MATVLMVGPLAVARAGVRPWEPAGIASPVFESHPAFDPRTGDLYFVRSSPQFAGWRYEHDLEAWPPDCPAGRP